MSTATLERPTPTTLRITPAGVVRSEWTKFRSLRSMWVTLLVAVGLVVGLGALIAGVQVSHWTPTDPAGFDAVTSPLAGVGMAQLAIGVLGVLLVSGEYATGMIRSTLTAVPRRLPVLWAKLGVLSGVTLVASTVATFVAFFLGQALASGKHLDVSITSAGALRSVISAAVYLGLVGVIGMALGSLLRNTAAAISSVVALLFVIPIVLMSLPSSWTDHFAKYLPAAAGQVSWSDVSGSHLGPYAGLVVMGLWALVAVGAAAVALVKRDA